MSCSERSQNITLIIVLQTNIFISYRYLKEVSKQFKTEKAMMADSMTRYKEALDRRFNKASRLLSYLDVPVSFTQKGKIYIQNTPGRIYFTFLLTFDII